MTHLIITIELTVDELMGKLTEQEAREASVRAYAAARKSLIQFTNYSVDDFSFKIEQ